MEQCSPDLQTGAFDRLATSLKTELKGARPGRQGRTGTASDAMRARP